MRPRPFALTALTTCFLLAAAADAATIDAARLLPNGRQPWPGILTGGQPSPEQLDALAGEGVRTVISLRTEGESPSGRADVEARGMAFVSIPIAGAEDLSAANAAALRQALDAAERPVLVHCGSSNRVGAVFALDAFYRGGVGVEKALAAGRDAGLTSLEEAVRAVLEAAQPDSQNPAPSDRR